MWSRRWGSTRTRQILSGRTSAPMDVRGPRVRSPSRRSSPQPSEAASRSTPAPGKKRRSAFCAARRNRSRKSPRIGEFLSASHECWSPTSPTVASWLSKPPSRPSAIVPASTSWNGCFVAFTRWRSALAPFSLQPQRPAGQTAGFLHAPKSTLIRASAGSVTEAAVATGLRTILPAVGDTGRRQQFTRPTTRCSPGSTPRSTRSSPGSRPRRRGTRRSRSPRGCLPGWAMSRRRSTRFAGWWRRSGRRPAAGST
jgi:hypothetical protein